jgi:hypothetical protein
MKELTAKQISGQDFVDRVILQLVQTVNPTDRSIQWNIEMIGEIRNVIRDCIVGKMTDEQNLCAYLDD